MRRLVVGLVLAATVVIGAAMLAPVARDGPDQSVLAPERDRYAGFQVPERDRGVVVVPSTGSAPPPPVTRPTTTTDPVTTTTAPVTTTTAPVTTTTAPPPADPRLVSALRPADLPPELPVDDLLLDAPVVAAVVPGAERAPDDLLGTGPLDLDRAAAAEVDATAERALLETRGFRRGVSRAFTTPAGDTVYLQAYELRDADAAATYLVDGADMILARAGQPYEVDGLPGAMGFTQVDRAGGGAFTAHGVAFAHDRLHLLVVVGSAEATRTPAEAAALAVVLEERLSALG